MKLKVTLIILLGTLLCPIQGFAKKIEHDKILSFETGVPDFIKGINSTISTSKKHYKDGQQSLHWSYKAGGELVLSKELDYEAKVIGDSFLSSFTAWVYNSKPSDNAIQFVFYKDGKKCTSFSYNIDFSGWRAIYVSYDRDMTGIPQEGMNELRIVAPEYDGGELFFDMMVTGSKVDNRHHTQDLQQPFVNKGVTNHWQIMLDRSQIAPDVDLYNAQVTPEEKQYMAVMEQRLRKLIENPTKVTDQRIDNIEKKYKVYDIKRENGEIKGLPLFYVYYAEAFARFLPKWNRKLFVQNGQEFKQYFELMHNIANCYVSITNEEQKSRLEKMFINMYDHAKDQGVAYGSGLGNSSHYGYSFRGFFTSYFLMKDVLQKNGRLTEAFKALQWYAQTNEVFERPIVNGQDMDAFNTLAEAKMCSILMMDDSPEKLQYIKAYSRWVDTGCKPSPGLTGAFKVDGGAFHHVGHYPAYAVGGLTGVTDMLYVFHDTPFAISQEGHETIKNVLMVMRFYCNTTHFPLALSGRHPDGKGQLIPMHFARMAVSGTPDGKDKIDKDMAAAYLRLVDTSGDKEMAEYMPKTNKREQDKMLALFKKEGISAENDPEGNTSIGYAATSVHRRKNWSAVVKGHSRYLWASEHYVQDNFYGRYLAYGGLQILTNKDGGRVNPFTSGWIQEGFNWARIPGTTAINLPLDELRAPKKFSEMLISDEEFVGGISQNSTNGAYGMKLHEHDRYNGSHRARISYHFFGDRIICLGTDIENINNEYNTETTIFQLNVADPEAKKHWEVENLKKEFWKDHLGTSYYIPKSELSKLKFEKNFPQNSRRENNAEPTSGDWVNLVFDYGKSPKNQSYEYVVMPQLEDNKVKDVTNSYQVIQKDRDAHIVKDIESNTTSFVLFETPKSLPQSIIQSVDTASLVMLQENKDNITLTVANPDLAFYRGKSQEHYDKDGKRLVLNIYARPWRTSESKEVPVEVTLKGQWDILNNDGFVKINVLGEVTKVKFMCRHAQSINVKFRKRQ